jgi:uncharacterized membrane protein
MKIDREVTFFVAAILLVAGTISVYLVIKGDNVVMPYSEIGILGANMMVGDYLTEPEPGEDMGLNIYLGNHEGRLMYYTVLVKLVDATGDVGSEPLDAPVLGTYGAVVPHGENHTIQFQTRLHDIAPNQRLVFELHAYNGETQAIEYTGRWCHLWLNTEQATT